MAITPTTTDDMGEGRKKVIEQEEIEASKKPSYYKFVKQYFLGAEEELSIPAGVVEASEGVAVTNNQTTELCEIAKGNTEQLPQRRLSLTPPTRRLSQTEDEEGGEEDVTFLQDFIAGGIAGSASVVVGHPFDTIKVRIQSSTQGGGILNSLTEFGGASSLFRGIGAPLASAAVLNAVVFASYSSASKRYDDLILGVAGSKDDGLMYPQLIHDPWPKAVLCGAFAGFTQCFIVCPMEHVKCRLQVQHAKHGGRNDYTHFKGPMHAMRSIVKEYGFFRLYQGWWSSLWRELSGFGLYFSTYDVIKAQINSLLAQRAVEVRYLHNGDPHSSGNHHLQQTGTRHSQAWFASALAGGIAGSITWVAVYPVDVIKTHIQTAPLDTPGSELRVWTIGTRLAQEHGWRFLFRGFTVTVLRAFPVNATLFPIYEYTLLQIRRWEL